MKLPGQLVDALLQGTLVPFVGAGFSVPSGCPSWPTMIHQMVAEQESDGLLQVSALGQRPLPDVAEVLDRLGYSSERATQFFVSKLDDPRLEPSKYHQLLSQLNFRTILTTNWDTLLERGFRENGDRTRVVYRNDDVPTYDVRSGVNIVKLHGSIESPRSLVFRASQYDEYIREHQPLIELTSTILSTHHAIFIGYGLGDPNILELLSRIRSRFGTFTKQHWIVAPPHSPLEAEWRRLGLSVLPLEQSENQWDPGQATMELLTAMSATAVSASGSNLERARLVNRELERTISEGRPRGTLRMRGQLGWLSNPRPDPDRVVYGSAEQDAEEFRMSELVREFLAADQGNRVRMMINVDVQFLNRKYKRAAALWRLETLRDNLTSLAEQVEVVAAPHHFGMNEMILDERAALVGYRGATDLSIHRVLVSRDSGSVARQARLFDADFEGFLPSGETLGARKMDAKRDAIERLDVAIQWLSRDDTGGRGAGSEAIAGALEWAIGRHNRAGQTREDGVTPYWVHPARVLTTLVEFEPTASLEAQKASLLHDLVEDTDTSLEEISEAFGAETAAIVDGVTHRDGQTWQEYLEQLSSADRGSRLVKLADRLDNVLELTRRRYASYGGMNPDEYLTGSLMVVDACGSASEILAEAVRAAVAAARHGL